MNTPDSLNKESKNLFNLISKNWEELDDPLKNKLIKIWGVLTYKWQLQILFNLPFLLWWALDKSYPKVHEFDATILNLLQCLQYLRLFRLQLKAIIQLSQGITNVTIYGFLIDVLS